MVPLNQVKQRRFLEKGCTKSCIDGIGTFGEDREEKEGETMGGICIRSAYKFSFESYMTETGWSWVSWFCRGIWRGGWEKTAYTLGAVSGQELVNPGWVGDGAALSFYVFQAGPADRGRRCRNCCILKSVLTCEACVTASQMIPEAFAWVCCSGGRGRSESGAKKGSITYFAGYGAQLAGWWCKSARTTPVTLETGGEESLGIVDHNG